MLFLPKQLRSILGRFRAYDQDRGRAAAKVRRPGRSAGAAPESGATRNPTWSRDRRSTIEPANQAAQSASIGMPYWSRRDHAQWSNLSTESPVRSPNSSATSRCCDASTWIASRSACWAVRERVVALRRVREEAGRIDARLRRKPDQAAARSVARDGGDDEHGVVQRTDDPLERAGTGYLRHRVRLVRIVQKHGHGPGTSTCVEVRNRSRGICGISRSGPRCSPRSRLRVGLEKDLLGVSISMSLPGLPLASG